MSSEYARRGGMDVSRGPSGTARPAMMTVVRMTISGRTTKFVSARVLSLRPKKISSGELSWIATWTWVTRSTSESSRGPNGEIGMRRGSRPHRIPRPMPRKLAMSRKLRKKPT